MGLGCCLVGPPGAFQIERLQLGELGSPVFEEERSSAHAALRASTDQAERRGRQQQDTTANGLALRLGVHDFASAPGASQCSANARGLLQSCWTALAGFHL